MTQSFREKITFAGLESACAASAIVLTYGALRFLVAPMLHSVEAFPPFGGDFWLSSFFAKVVLEQGWYPMSSTDYGFPFGFDAYGFPTADALHLSIIKMLGMFGKDWLWVVKAFYVSSFFLSTSVAFAALRVAGSNRLFAICTATLFACLPYPFLRTSHLFLASTVAIPLAFLCILYVWRGLSWHRHDGETGSRGGIVLFLVLSMVIGTGGLYYAFFACLFVVVTGVAAAWRDRRPKLVLVSFLAAATIGGTVFVQVFPSVHQRATEGENFSMWKRSFEQTESFGWKLAQALLPTPNHRLQAFAAAEVKYSAKAPMVNENRSSALGVLGGLGLLSSLVYLAAYGLQGGADRRSDVRALLGLLSLVGILYATVGGFGVLFSMFVSPEIRGVNRISVYLGFFGLAFMAITAQKFLQRRTAWGRHVVLPVSAIVTILALLDQVPVVETSASVKEIADQRMFFGAITQRLRSGTKVFELPYHPFPEGGRIGDFEDYEQLKGPLFAPGLGWSQPTFRGREGDLWNRQVATLPVSRMVAELAQAGFGALLVDFRGYQAAAPGMREALIKALGQPAVAEDNLHRSVWLLEATDGPLVSPHALSLFSPVSGSQPRAAAGGQCNLDMFDDGAPAAFLHAKHGSRFALAGWALLGQAAAQSASIAASGTGGRWTAPMHTGLARPDVSQAIAGADKNAGVLLYASPDGLPSGEYALSLVIDTPLHAECALFPKLVVQ